MDIATVMPSDAGEHRPAADAPCAELIPLLSASRLTGTPAAMAGATLSVDAGPDGLWVGTEVLRTYADAGARRAMSDLRTFLGRCPTVASSGRVGGSYRFTVSAGPPLGDESLRVGCTMTSGTGILRCDSILVRIGTDLVVVQEQGNTPGDGRYLIQLTEAALRRYQATGS
ncbi:hypothetical protein ACFO0M_02585 [Micromonospora mangrovi]|uniref:Uncharacterized protein n=2 Tax=Micromonospora TaxID=1873 RepID=A0AAU8H8H6_9ACTN